MSRITRSDCRSMDQLMATGTILDPVAVAEAKIASADLRVIPVGDRLEDEFALEVGRRYAVNFSIVTHIVIKNTTDRPIRLGDVPVSMVLPFDCVFHLLAPDEAETLGRYILTPCRRQFPLESALNHYLQPGQILRPRKRLEGFLLGQGAALVPLEYSVRDSVLAEVMVHTEEDDTYSSWITLCVSHCKTKNDPQYYVRRQGGLFDKKDPVPVRRTRDLPDGRESEGRSLPGTMNVPAKAEPATSE